MTTSMSNFVTHGKYWTTDCIRHPKRRLCVCCPNGIHIDVDFDVFYKTLTTMQKPEDATRPYKHVKRKQDPTIDALLGHHTQQSVNVDEIVYKSRDLPAKASPDVQESLEQALHDFEETLIRSSSSDVRSPLMSPLLNNHFSSSLSIRSDAKSECLSKLVNGEKYEEPEPISPTDFTDSFQKQVKNIGISCTVLTRDIGTICSPVSNQSRATNTVRDTKDTSTITEDQNETKFSLNQILQEPKFVNIGTQTTSRFTSLMIIEKRDRGVQTETDTIPTKDCRLRSIYEFSKSRSVATNTDTEFQRIVESKRMYSKYVQTKDVIVKDRVFMKKTGCQTDIRMQKFKDVGVNTARKKMVDASTTESPVQNTICERCQNMKISPVSNQSVSKIPRPKNIQLNTHSNKKKLLMRQDTYVTIPSTELERLKELQSQELQQNRDIHSPANIQTTLTSTSPTEICADESYFQPISENKIKGEPSKEMKAAMKVFNDSLKKPTFEKLRETTLKNATAIIQQEWFKVSSLSTANPLTVEDYLDAFEEVSTNLLEYIVNMRDGAGNTAMHYAVSHGNFDVVSILLDSKVCDINIVNDAGYTCIMLVSLAQIKSNTHCDVIKRLFSMADVNMKAKQHGQTTLMLAASHGKLDVVKLLLECGADVNIQDDDGSTALMCAAEHGYLDIVKTLAAHPDCDLKIKDHDGSNALTIAMEAGHREIGIALYARQHFTDLNQSSSPEKRSRSANPILMEHRARRPSLKSAPSSPSTMA